MLVLMHEDLVPPDTLTGYSPKEVLEWRTEFDVVKGLKTLGHEALALGVRSDLTPIRDAIDSFRPHITFNLLEEFHGVPSYDQHVVSYLELLRKRYTGCNPRGLMLARDKALSKQLLAFHKVPVPRFAVFPMGRKPRRPKRLEFPLLVKSLTAEGSAGISQASVVTNDEKLAERVEFIHSRVGTDAIAEQYIDGREIYVGVMGNVRLEALPVWEMNFESMPEAAYRIASQKVKWDEQYQARIGYTQGPSTNLSPEKQLEIQKLAKRIYRRLGLSGYARLDFRVTPGGDPYLLEANPNPQISSDGEFAESAKFAGIAYPELLHKILTLGMSYRAAWVDAESEGDGD
ncbi:MAG: ATP-grasp domain-containing protein [Polyangiales bacterium]